MLSQVTEDAFFMREQEKFHPKRFQELLEKKMSSLRVEEFIRSYKYENSCLEQGEQMVDRMREQQIKKIGVPRQEALELQRKLEMVAQLREHRKR